MSQTNNATDNKPPQIEKGGNESDKKTTPPPEWFSIISSILVGIIIGFYFLYFKITIVFGSYYPFIHYYNITMAISVFISIVSPFILSILKFNIKFLIPIFTCVMFIIACIVCYAGFEHFKPLGVIIVAPIFSEFLWSALGGYFISFSVSKRLHLNFGIMLCVATIFLNMSEINNFRNYDMIRLVVATGAFAVVSSFSLIFLRNEPSSSIVGENCIGKSSVRDYYGSLKSSIKENRMFMILLVPSLFFAGYFQIFSMTSVASNFFITNGYAFYSILLVIGVLSFLAAGLLSTKTHFRLPLSVVSFILGVVGCIVLICYPRVDSFDDTQGMAYSSSILTLISFNGLIVLSFSAISKLFPNHPLFVIAFIRFFYNIGLWVVLILNIEFYHFLYLSKNMIGGILTILFISFVFLIITLVKSKKIDNSISRMV